ncbi:MAG TPA: hypothetical protein ENH81_01320 [Thermococcus sp.]|nr:hypothetical protein [Thermococcus sp.]
MKTWKKISGIALALLLLFFVIHFYFLTHEDKSENVSSPQLQQALYSGYTGYAFVTPNTTLRFNVLWAGQNAGPGFSLHVEGIPKGINWSVEAVDVSCPDQLREMSCRDISLMLNPTAPGNYSLSQVTISVKTNAGTVSAKLGEVRLEVVGKAFENLTHVYYPYAGAYVDGNITPGSDFMYYVVLKNTGTDNLSITGVHIDDQAFRILGLYYQDIPPEVPPQLLDVPNMSKALEFPKDGLIIRPNETIAVIVPFRAKVQARYALVIPKLTVVDSTGKMHNVPGIPYYIMGASESEKGRK